MMAIMGGDPGQLSDQPQLSSTYPSAPMEYANVFTNENVKFGRIPPPPPIIKVTQNLNDFILILTFGLFFLICN